MARWSSNAAAAAFFIVGARLRPRFSLLERGCGRVFLCGSRSAAPRSSQTFPPIVPAKRQRQRRRLPIERAA